MLRKCSIKIMGKSRNSCEEIFIVHIATNMIDIVICIGI